MPELESGTNLSPLSSERNFIAFPSMSGARSGRLCRNFFVSSQRVGMVLQTATQRRVSKLARKQVPGKRYALGVLEEGEGEAVDGALVHHRQEGVVGDLAVELDARLDTPVWFGEQNVAVSSAGKKSSRQEK